MLYHGTFKIQMLPCTFAFVAYPRPLQFSARSLNPELDQMIQADNWTSSESDN